MDWAKLIAELIALAPDIEKIIMILTTNGVPAPQAHAIAHQVVALHHSVKALE